MGALDTVQQEQLRAIGTYLSEVRQEQERSLEDIAAKTYIPLRLLKAIEAGQERPLPEPVFIQGFIRRYADTLGLDGIDLSQKFPVHVTPLPTVSTSTAKAPAVSTATPTQRDFNLRQVNEPDSRSRSTETGAKGLLAAVPPAWLPYIAAAALLAVVGIALAVVRSVSQKQPAPTESGLVLPKQPTPEATSSVSVASTPDTSPSPTAAASPRSTATPSPTSPSPAAKPASDAPVKVEMRLSDASWVQIVVDGVVKEETTLPKGTSKSWSGKKEITIVAGNAGAVSVVHNGGAATTLGAVGDVAEKTFTAKASP